MGEKKAKKANERAAITGRAAKAGFLLRRALERRRERENQATVKKIARARKKRREEGH